MADSTATATTTLAAASSASGAQASTPAAEWGFHLFGMLGTLGAFGFVALLIVVVGYFVLKKIVIPS